jgi:hypothetical protein
MGLLKGSYGLMFRNSLLKLPLVDPHVERNDRHEPYKSLPWVEAAPDAPYFITDADEACLLAVRDCCHCYHELSRPGLGGGAQR